MNHHDHDDDDIIGGENSSPDPALAAEQQFTHGLLRTLDESEQADQDRTRSVMAAIRRPVSNPVNDRGRPFARVISGVAAIIVFSVALVILNGTGRSAIATISDTVAATKRVGDRSYRISVSKSPQGGFQLKPDASLDVRSNDMYLFRDRTREGRLLIAGADNDGQWKIRRSGGVLRDPPGHHEPLWIEIGSDTLLMTSIDGLVDTLPENYMLKMVDSEPLEPGDPTDCLRITAVPRDASRPGPTKIDLWIDPDSQLVARMDIILGDTPYRRPRHHHPGGEPHHGGRPHPPGHGSGQEHNKPRPPRHHDAPGLAGNTHLRPHPRAIRFELDAIDALADEWFLPQTHQQKP